MAKPRTVKLSSKQPNTLRRNIYFYRVDAGADVSGTPIVIDLQQKLKSLNDLPFALPDGRYHLTKDGNYYVAWVDQLSEISRIRFAIVRRIGLPQSEIGGRLRDLSLSAEEGLCETTHICIFPDNIVGVEYNFHGPRASRLPVYLNSVHKEVAPPFVLEALLRHDVSEQLERKEAVRAMTLRVRRAYIDVIEQVDRRMGNALDATVLDSGAECVGIILEPEKYKRHNLNPRILESIKRLVARDDLRENARKFEGKFVDKGSRAVDEINLLDDQLISRKAILKVNSRSNVLDSTDAYLKIEEAYQDLRQDLLSASSANLKPT